LMAGHSVTALVRDPQKLRNFRYIH
jgi:hypothetical protein